MSYTSQDHLPMIPRRKSPSTAGVIRITPSFLEMVENIYSVIVVVLFAGAFVKMVYGDLKLDEVPKAYWYLTTSTLYGAGVLFLLLSVFYRRLPIRVPVTLVLLLALAAISSAWSPDPGGVLLKWIALFGTSLIGIYFAVRFQPRELFNILWWGFAIMAVSSLLAVLFFPEWNIDSRSDPGHTWWRGVFPFKQGLGFNMLLAVIVFVFTHFDRANVGPIRRLANPAILCLALFLLAVSDSTGSQVLAFIFAAILAYVAFARRLGLVRGPLTLLVLWLMAVIGWMVASDLGTFTDLLGKDATLTGRTEVWGLSLNLIAQKPLLGYGYATDALQRFVSWHSAHNGFITLIMQLGLVGCGLLLVLLAQTGWKCYETAMSSSAAMASWPLVILVVMVTRNFAETMFLSSNSLPWILFVYLFTSGALNRGRVNLLKETE